MKSLRYGIFFLMLSFFAGIMDATSQDAKTILENMDKIIFSPKDKQGKVTIILTDKAGKEKIREAIMLQKGRDKKLYRYTKPESQAGIATLSLSDDVMWLYMPAFEKPKKISMLAKDQSFTGTDFSYEDMANITLCRQIYAEFTGNRKRYLCAEADPQIRKLGLLKNHCTN